MAGDHPSRGRVLLVATDLMLRSRVAEGARAAGERGLGEGGGDGAVVVGRGGARLVEDEVVVDDGGGDLDALGRDLARTVAFFRRVDTIKPSQKEFMEEHDFASKDSVDFIRAYEAEIVRTIEAELPEAPRR